MLDRSLPPLRSPRSELGAATAATVECLVEGGIDAEVGTGEVAIMIFVDDSGTDESQRLQHERIQQECGARYLNLVSELRSLEEAQAPHTDE